MILNRARIIIGESPLAARLVGDGIWALINRSSIGFFGLVIGALHTRLLSPGDVGEYAFALSLVAPAAVLAQLGLGATSIREIAASMSKDAPHAAREIVWQTLLWGAIGILGTAILFLFLGNVLGLRTDITSIAVAWIAVITVTKLLGEILRGFHDIRGSVLISGSNYGGIVPHFVTVALLLLAWSFFGSLDLTALMLLMLIGATSSVALGFYLLKKVMPAGTSSSTRSHARIDPKMMRESFPILVSMITDILWSQSAIWILITYTSSESLAVYDTARRLVALISVALTIANIILPPLIAELYAKGEMEQLERLLRRSATVIGVPALVGLAILIYFGESILGLVYGDFYRVGGRILTILTLGATSQVLTGSCGVVLNMTGKQDALMKVMVLGTLLTTGCAIFVAPRWGTEGVAVVMASGLAIQNIAKMLLVKRLVGVWTFVGL